MCKLITTCQIGPFEYKIFETEKDDSKLYINDKWCRGTIYYDEQSIYIYEGLDLLNKENVLRHELSHGFIAETQIIYRENYNEEELCEFVAMYGKNINDITNRFISIITNNNKSNKKG